MEWGGRQQHLWSGEGVSSTDGVVRASAALMEW